MDAGFELQREIVQRGHSPVVLRQYDSMEASRMFSAYARADQALLLAVSEGPRGRVEAERLAISEIAEELGASAADPAATERWFSDRNHVPTLRSFLEGGIVVDTIEVAATWDRIGAIYAGAVAALSGVPGILAASAHSSHVYRSGINLYFTFAVRPDAGHMEAAYLECWRRVMQATADGGGGIAHHHGIGRVRRGWLESDVGPAGVAALRRVKAALDPEGIFNPGVLLPGGSEKKA
jgi:alkyldihydroxyacetonephosphate synthase